MPTRRSETVVSGLLGGQIALMVTDFVMPQQQITADYGPGEHEDVTMHDGSTLRLRKLEEGYDPHDRVAALAHVQTAQDQGEVVTGLLYVDADAADCHEINDTVETPLNALTEADLCPGSAALDAINASLR